MNDDRNGAIKVIMTASIDAPEGRRIIGTARMVVEDREPHGDFVGAAMGPVGRLAGATGSGGEHALYGAFLTLWSGMDVDDDHAETRLGRDLTLAIDRHEIEMAA